MQLDGELIDIARDFGALRFVFDQLPPNIVGVGQRVCTRSVRLRNGCELIALLTGQRHPRGGSIRHQSCFAMLAMKEDVGIGRDFTQRIFRRFHDEQTSRRCARLRVELRRGRPNECRSDAVGAVTLAPSCAELSRFQCFRIAR